MVVRAHYGGRGATELYIGSRNARQHFPKHMKNVELQMGHLRIRCELQPDFWQGRPEICDRRLSSWLETRVFHHRPRRAPVPVAMIPLGKNAFRLHVFPLPSVAGNGLTRIGPLPAPLRPYEGKGKRSAAPGRPRRFVDG